MNKSIVLSLLLSIAFFSGCKEGLKKNNIESSSDLTQLRNRAVRIVQENLSHEVAVMRINAIEVIAQTNLQQLMPVVHSLATDESVAVRFSSIVAIGDMNDRNGLPIAINALNDPDENVKMAAAYTVTLLERRNLSDVIRASLQNTNPTVRSNAAMLLGKLGNKKDLTILYKILRDSQSNDHVRIQTLESIAMLGDESVYRRLWALLISKHPDDRVMGIRCMGALDTTESRDAIVTMLDDDLWEVKLAAAEQLGRMGIPSGAPEVMLFLQNESKDYQASIAMGMATMAIGRIGTEELSQYLPELIMSKSPGIQLRAAQSVLLITNNTL